MFSRVGLLTLAAADPDRETFIDDGSEDDMLEREADRFAADTLIPAEHAPRLPALTTSEDVVAFANELGIAPGDRSGAPAARRHLAMEPRERTQARNAHRRRLAFLAPGFPTEHRTTRARASAKPQPATPTGRYFLLITTSIRWAAL